MIKFRLTRRKAIKISIELWEWLAKTGKHKDEWDGWKKYGEMTSLCPLCEYSTRAGEGCTVCPYREKFGICLGSNSPFAGWFSAKTNTDHKKYAKLFLEQLRQL